MNRPASKYRPRCCNECGSDYTPRRADEFYCSTACRKLFDNRAMARGRDLYHLFMVMRYERGLAKALSLWGIMCAMARKWREEDNRDRAGRKSWVKPQRVIQTALEATAGKRATSLSMADIPGVMMTAGSKRED